MASNAERQATWRARRDARLAALEAEVARLRAENESLRNASPPRDKPSPNAEVATLRAQVAALQAELAQAHGNSEEAEAAALNAAAAALPEAEQSQLNKLHARIKAWYERRVEKEVQKEVQKRYDAHFVQEVALAAEKKVAPLLVEERARARAAAAEWQDRMKSLDAWMTEAEYKLVLGCLHPDRHPENEAEKYNRAFQIFKRLERHVDPSKRARKRNGWDR